MGVTGGLAENVVKKYRGRVQECFHALLSSMFIVFIDSLFAK